MKKSLILLHGALGSKLQLQILAKELAKQYQVHVFDFEGHGENYSNSVFSIDLFIQNTLDYIKNNNLNNPLIFGYSMGGYVALKLAYTNSKRVDRIITLGTKFDWTPISAEKEIKMLHPELIEQKVPQFAAHLSRIHSTKWKTVVKKTAEMMLALGNGHGLSNSQFAQIKTRVLILIGDLDKMVTIKESEEIAEIIPNATLNILNGVEHPIEKIDPILLSELIKKFAT